MMLSITPNLMKWRIESKRKVVIMGPLSWFLGCNYDWYRLPDGCLSCHISQQAYVEYLVDKFGLADGLSSNRLFKQGLPINRIYRNTIPKEKYAEFVKSYEFLMGGLTWLVTSIRPGINVATKLLSQFNCSPSLRHMDSAKYVLWYLKDTTSHGIWFTKGEKRLHSNVACSPALNLDSLTAFTKANWGAQD